MADRGLLLRVRRSPRHRAMASGVLSSGGDRLAHAVFNDYLQDYGFRHYGPGELTMLELEKNYYVETVTKYWTGKLVEQDCDYLTLVDAAGIPETGRFHLFVSGTAPEECEPVPDGRKVRIPIGAITAVIDYPHPLPRRVV